MKVRVWNDNTYPYREKFRERLIEIPSKDFVEMEYDEAHLFLGTYSPMKHDGDGNDIAAGYKMLRIEQAAATHDSAKAVDKLLCQACRYLAVNEKDLAAHIDEAHQDAILVDEEAEEQIKKKKKG